MVSVIVPAYNAEKYLHECVESIFSQSVADWELLLINDGSTDGTGAICDGYASADARVRVIHQPNAGVSAARNRGLDEALGEWIAFLDADDVMYPDFMKRLLDTAAQTGAEIAACDYVDFKGKWPGAPAGTRVTPSSLLGSRDAIEGALYQTWADRIGGKLDPSPWGKIYARRLWRGLRFRPGRFEDLDIFYRVWGVAERIAFVPVIMLGYRQHGESFLHQFTSSRLDVLDVTDRMVEYYTGRPGDADLLKAARTRRFAAHWNVLLLVCRALRKGLVGQQDAAPVMARCRRIIRDMRGEVLRNPKVRLKDRLGALAAYLPGVC